MFYSSFEESTPARTVLSPGLEFSYQQEEEPKREKEEITTRRRRN